MKRANFFKRWKIALVVIITKLLTFHGAFASMGSTGGGVGSSSGGGSSSSSSIISSGNDKSGDSFKAFLFVLFLKRGKETRSFKDVMNCPPFFTPDGRIWET